MKKIFTYSFLFLLAALGGCDKFLDRQPLDSISSETFLATEQEMELGLNGVYAASFWALANNTPLHFAIESATDLAIKRTGNSEDQVAMGDGGPFLVGNALTSTAWSQAYKLVSRANYLLDGMKKGQAAASPRTYSRIRAEGLVLRAWAYYHLIV